MRKIVLLLMINLFMWAGVGAEERSFNVVVTDVYGVIERKNEPVVINLAEIAEGLEVRSAVVYDGTAEIPCQIDDLDGDLTADEMVFVTDVPTGKSKVLTVKLSSESVQKDYPSKVYAEMLVSDKNGRHVPVLSVTTPGTSDIYNQMHHHGPAFESELTAYRIYFDRKQTVDIYGKFNKGLEIRESQFYPTDEQLARGFGDDVLLVGGSCGLGTLKGWDGDKAVHIEPVKSRTETVVASGPVRTVVDITANGWQYGGKQIIMRVRYILYAGHRDCEVEVSFAQPLGAEVFCTGVQNIIGSTSFSDHKGLVACWGTHWPVNDTVKYAKETVGLATILPHDVIISEKPDRINFLYQISAPGRTAFKYHIAFTSKKETFGYKTPEEWFAYARRMKETVLNPCKIEVKPVR